MKERPILFSAPMVRALLAGTKTQTRRVAKPVRHPDLGNLYAPGALVLEHEPQHVIDRCNPYGQPGDRLWVRETHAFVPEPAYRCSTGVYQQINPEDAYQACIYREGFDRCFAERWRPSIHMPRWASRITLEITAVRVERLQDISREDAMAEGIVIQPDGGWGLADTTHYHATDPRQSYFSLWEAINGPGSVEANPWVWAVTFAAFRPNT